MVFSRLVEQIKGIIRPQDDEPAYEEAVDHDIVMIQANGNLVEVTEDDPEKRR